MKQDKKNYQGKHLKENVTKTLRPSPVNDKPEFVSPDWLDAMMEEDKKKKEESDS